jgi:hypothetical protein
MSGSSIPVPGIYYALPYAVDFKIKNCLGWRGTSDLCSSKGAQPDGFEIFHKIKLTFWLVQNGAWSDPQAADLHAKSFEVGESGAAEGATWRPRPYRPSGRGLVAASPGRPESTAKGPRGSVPITSDKSASQGQNGFRAYGRFGRRGPKMIVRAVSVIVWKSGGTQKPSRTAA